MGFLAPTPKVPSIPPPPPAASPPTIANTEVANTIGKRKAPMDPTIGTSPQGLTEKAKTAGTTLLGGTK